MRRITLLPSFQNVAANSTAVLNCPVGLTYDSLTFIYGGTFTVAQMTNISVLVNGKEIRRYATGTELQAINAYYGIVDQANHLTIPFVRQEATDVDQERLCALGTADVQTLTVQLDIGAATAPTLVAYATQSEPRLMGLITKIKRFPITFAVSGLADIDKIPLGPRILAIHLGKADVNDVEIELDGMRLVKQTKLLGEQMQKQRGRVPQTASFTHVDFALEGDLLQALITERAADFRVRPTLGTSGLVSVIVEYLDGFAGI